ncbi:(E2-independent) E3 ubiquitin-conjugating enzyme FATS [Acanthochromis polyacanthus]|uniref:(E2-independent) E3 ubiquitin-conjugating enzyme FATS n=1 Tax=Acanthochromis polyacanthus TaxID=80966 RepID=UPI00223482FC|nr:(E2-independent) E3 ubiquitin-conjugating enzyme FATS [Acanthochromis polyacanthus]XP_051795538.1 (E2-independent) E3 ubiquitin-conjugating enzyme FATS [Acanthochromis polyacanthus]
MTLRRPAAHLRRAPGWRRSGDESYWESLVSEGELLPSAPRPQRPTRPQSAIEGGQLDSWLEHLQTMQSKLRTPTYNQAPAFSDRTASMPVLDREPSRLSWRQKGFPSFSRGSSSCGSSSLCGSSQGSQESLQTGFFPPPERRGSRERAHISQAPQKEQAELSYLAPVKIGWLPVQRRVMVADACNQNQFLDHTAGHVKLKQPITPTFQKNKTTPKTQDGEVERSHTGPGVLGVKTWQAPDQGSRIIKQVPEKPSFPSNEGDRPVGWQALRRGWNINRVSTFPGGSKSKELPTGTNSDPNGKSPLMKTTSIEPPKHSPPHHTTSADPYRPHTPLQGTNTNETYKSHTPLQRTSGVQPIKATTPLCGTNRSTQPSHIQTSSAVTTLIPQNKAGFSSITISSRKVSRSTSLPGSNNCSLPSSNMDPNSRQVTVQRKATIVKVTEKRVMSSPVPSTEMTGTPPTSHGLDTVVHRRKATIIKVTEHRESYGPTKGGSRHPEYRHSYTEGLYKDNSTWNQGNHEQNNTAASYSHPNSKANSAAAPNTFTSDPGKNGALHRSTLSLFVSNPPAIAAPVSSEASPKAVGRRSDRPSRPLSCYGSVIGHTEPSKENVTQPAARKWSFGLPQETTINPVNSDSSFISPGKAVKEAGQPVADTLKSNGGEKEGLPPPENAMRRASPSLTLIKAPDPHQSPEEVLALNAAAIIANIKLQRQLSKKKTPNGDSEKDSSPQDNTVTDEEKCLHVSNESQVGLLSRPHAAFVPLNPDLERSAGTVSLQQALLRSKPDFISRSQGRVRELERRAQERRELSESKLDAAVRQGRTHNSTWTTSVNGDLFRLKDKAITGKEMQPRSKRPFAEVKKKKDEEKKKETCLSNRQRVELFKKKLLDQVLQRSSN